MWTAKTLSDWAESLMGALVMLLVSSYILAVSSVLAVRSKGS